MTREVAKKRMYYEWQRFLEHNVDYGGISEAYQMAIKALEQEPCSDAVSRDDVLKVFGDVHPLDYNTNAYIRKIEELPSVQPQPKTGHWITTRTFMHDGEYYCDKCKCDSPNNEKWDYCPNCGTRMIEPQAESEEKRMNKKLAELTVKKSEDYYDKVVKALEDAGFVMVLTVETSTDKYYIIAESENKK